MMKTLVAGAFCSVRQIWAHSFSTLKSSGDIWVDKSLTNWKKAIEKITSHDTSKVHLQCCQSALLANQAETRSTIDYVKMTNGHYLGHSLKSQPTRLCTSFTA